MGGGRGESGGVTIPICQKKGVCASDLWFMSVFFHEFSRHVFYDGVFRRMRLRGDVSGFDQGLWRREGGLIKVRRFFMFGK